jgi:hypothetical protein
LIPAKGIRLKERWSRIPAGHKNPAAAAVYASLSSDVLACLPIVTIFVFATYATI